MTWGRVLAVAVLPTALGGCLYVPPLGNTDKDAVLALDRGVSTRAQVETAFRTGSVIDDPHFGVYHAHHDYGVWVVGVGHGYAGAVGAGTIQKRWYTIAARYGADGTLDRLEGFASGHAIDDPEVDISHRRSLAEPDATGLSPGDRQAFRMIESAPSTRSFVALDDESRLWLRPGSRTPNVVEVTPLVKNPGGIAIDLDGRLAAAAGHGVAVWDLRTGSLVFDSRDRPDGDQRFTAVALARSGVVCAGDKRGRVHVWHIDDPSADRALESGTRRRIVDIDCTPDLARVGATIEGDAAAVIWDGRSGAVVARLPDRKGPIGGLAILDREGRRWAVGHPSHVEIHQVEDDAPVLVDVVPLPHGSYGPAVASDGAGRLVVRGDGMAWIDLRSRVIVRHVGTLSARIPRSRFDTIMAGNFFPSPEDDFHLIRYGISDAAVAGDRVIVCTGAGLYDLRPETPAPLRFDRSTVDRW